MERELSIYSIIFLFCIRVGFSRDANGIPLEECQLKHPQNWTTLYCGYELGTNYSKQAVYSCKPEGGSPELFLDCNLSTIGDKHMKSKFCVKSNTSQFVRSCSKITFCTSRNNFCGLKNIEEVRNEIISTVPVEKRERKSRLDWLDDNIKIDKQKKF